MFVLAILANLLLGTSCLTDEELAAFKPRIENYIDINTGESAVVYAVDNGDGSQSIYTNGIPSHETAEFPDDDNPNSLSEYPVTMKIYSTPIMRETPLKCTPPGYVGIATSGTPIFNWFPHVEGCPDVKDFETLDICEGHPNPDEQYHYHYYSPCVQMPVCGEPSPIYGVAIDGIPIYGPFDDNGYQLTTEDLDECGGKYDKDGNYKYHIVADPPYTMNCFMGEIRSDIGKPEDEFICACPFDDSQYLSRDTQVRLEPVCTLNEEDDTQPIVCNDAEYLANLTYEIAYVWEYETKEIDLLPCCPQGSDCGTSCKDEDGIKEECEVETRTVEYLTRYARDSDDDDTDDEESNDDRDHPDGDDSDRDHPDGGESDRDHPDGGESDQDHPDGGDSDRDHHDGDHHDRDHSSDRNRDIPRPRLQ